MSRPVRWVLAATAALLLAAVVAGFLAWRELQPASAPTGAAIDVQIPRGATTVAVAELLEERGAVRNAAAFAWLARLRGDAESIQAGRYALPRGVPASEVLDLLVEGRTRLVEVVVPEGLTVEETAEIVARQTPIDAAAYLALARDSALADSLGVPGPAFEGYLFPETYNVDPAITARELIELQVRSFKEAFAEVADRARAMGFGAREVVTLASIVEAEARVSEERPLISSVYHNRLERGMLLEADPTVQYALGGHRERVLYEDLEVDSPYNTYRNPGLPPGPIGSPGRASLEAAVAPDTTDYLFFFWIGDSAGTHMFSRTYEEHLRKRAELGR